MDNGIRSLTVSHPVDHIVQRLTSLLSERGIKLFAIIDHSAEARAVGLDLSATKLLIFGNPKAGTPVMLTARSTALDLPLKILVAQEPDGSSSISWNDATWLQQRHGFWPEFVPTLAVVDALVREAVE